MELEDKKIKYIMDFLWSRGAEHHYQLLLKTQKGEQEWYLYDTACPEGICDEKADLMVWHRTKCWCTYVDGKPFEIRISPMEISIFDDQIMRHVRRDLVDSIELHYGGNLTKSQYEQFLRGESWNEVFKEQKEREL